MKPRSEQHNNEEQYHTHQHTSQMDQERKMYERAAKHATVTCKLWLAARYRALATSMKRRETMDSDI